MGTCNKMKDLNEMKPITDEQKKIIEDFIKAVENTRQALVLITEINCYQTMGKVLVETLISAKYPIRDFQESLRKFDDLCRELDV